MSVMTMRVCHADGKGHRYEAVVAWDNPLAEPKCRCGLTQAQVESSASTASTGSLLPPGMAYTPKPGAYEGLPKLPREAAARKRFPVATGVLDYFPDALAAIAEVSLVGNDQHNPGQPLHWAREKSRDQADCLVRHLLERGTKDSDGLRHTAKLAWRALALLQLEIEGEKNVTP